jgi:peptidoglycan/LPS O-acetylase OafA/YrhL
MPLDPANPVFTRVRPQSEIPHLNGIRAIAVLVVIVSHAGLGHLVPGGFGVTTFFVLSGYLISTLLIREHERTGTISFTRFYARRALRLLPPLYLVTALAILAVHLGWLGGGTSPGAIAAVLLYLANYHGLMFDVGGIPSGMVVTWSLAVEEHFYLLWPPIALWLLRGRLDRRTLSLVLISASLLALAWRTVLIVHLDASWIYTERATDTRFDSLLAGCWLALVANPWLAPPARSDLRRDAALLVCAGVLLLTSLLIRDETFRATLRYSLQNVGLVALFWLVLAYPRFAPFRLLSHPVMDYIGRVSYTLYLAHLPLLMGFAQKFPDGPAWLRYGVPVLLCFAFAELMRRSVEDPAARLRLRLHAPSPAAPLSPETPAVSRPS